MSATSRGRTYPSGWAKKKMQQKKAADRKKNANALLNKYSFTVIRKSTSDLQEEAVKEVLENVVQQVIEVEKVRVRLSASSTQFSSNDDIQFINLPLPSEMNADAEKKEIPSTDHSDMSFNPDPDPATWIVISNEMIEYFVINPPLQNINLISETEKKFIGGKRSLTKANFYHTKINGEKLLRKWMVLSASTKLLFCWVCKLFNVANSNSSKGQLVTGFSDWKHASTRLKEHESSAAHKQAMMNMSLRSQKSQRVDSSLVQQCEDESKYWISVLRRVVAVIKTLALRGLPFFGDNETIGSRHNGLFLGCLELIAEFDPLLSLHLEKYGNPGKGNVSYLSSTCVNQFIDVMARKVRTHIINEIQMAKYYSIIIDSTPDITHLDQLCFVVRYVADSQPEERFLGFIPIYSHKSESLADTVLGTLNEAEIDILNCRGQAYDNASNMAGKYSGLQARIKNVNPSAEFVPCAAHSLNLVGVNAVDSCTGAVQFFNLVQKLYTFFSASTQRWQILNERLKENKGSLTLKNRCLTRWCADAEAIKALRKSYHIIIVILTNLSTNADENGYTRSEALGILKKLNKFETVFNIVLWDTLLCRLNKTSSDLQKAYVNLNQVIPLYQSLIEFTQYVRDNFKEYENMAKDIYGTERDYYYEVSRKRKPKRKANSNEANFTPRETYKINIYYAICDALITHLVKRKDPYDTIAKKFACMTAIKETSTSTLRENAIFLQKLYPTDLDDSFPDELQQFSSLVEKGSNIAAIFKKLKSLQLDETFPNVDSALRIFLTLPVSNCSGERSFSLLKRLKSPMRSCILQEKLNSLAILCIEGDITQKLDYTDIIHDFAYMKSRKKSELFHCKYFSDTDSKCTSNTN